MIYVNLHRIQPNPYQTRQVHDGDHIQALADDIAARAASRPDTRGLLQLPAGRLADESGAPPAHRPEPAMRGDITRYLETQALFIQLAYGHNRLSAFRLLSETNGDYRTMPVELVRFTDQEMATAAWSENAQRRDLSPVEQAEAIHRMMQAFTWTQERVAQELGLSRSAVANKLRLLRLVGPARQALLAGEVTERQAMAILPAFELPAPALERAQGDSYWTADKLLEMAREGVSSDTLRDRAGSVIRQATRALADAPFPLDHPFDPTNTQYPISNIQSPRCDDCPVLVRHKNQKVGGRCPDFTCWDAKEATWSAARLAQAAEALGIPPAAEDQSYKTEETFYGADPDLVAEILQEGCSHGNLRLRFGSRWGFSPDGFPDVQVVCHHGEDARRCHCLAAKKAARTREDPQRAEQRERERQIRDQVIQPTTSLLLEALQENNVAIWHEILNAMTYNRYRGKSENWSLDRLQQKIVTLIVEDKWIHYAGNLDAARSAVTKRLADVGLPAPWQTDPAADLTNRLERVAGWVRDLPRQDTPPTPEAVQGNLDNLANLCTALESLDDCVNVQSEAADCGSVQSEAVDKTDLSDHIERLARVLAAVQDVLPHWDHIDDTPQWARHGAWLVNVPAGDVNFRSNLEQVTRPAVIRYAAALILQHDGIKTKTKAFNRRLRQLEKAEPDSSGAAP